MLIEPAVARVSMTALQVHLMRGHPQHDPGRRPRSGAEHPRPEWFCPVHNSPRRRERWGYVKATADANA